MDEREKNDWHVTYYLRKMNRKMTWAFIIFVVYLIGKSWEWIKLLWDWLIVPTLN